VTGSRSMNVGIELFATIHDPDHKQLSIIISDDQIILHPHDGPRIALCRGSVERIGDLLRRYDLATSVASAPGQAESQSGTGTGFANFMR